MKLKIAICQAFPKLGNFSHNIAEHSNFINSHKDCDLICFPELSTTGYFVKDLAYDLAMTRDEFSEELNKKTSYKQKSMSIIAGFSERANGLIYNSLFVGSGDLSYSHRKIYPPTYGIFDEYRYFSCGEKIDPFLLKNNISIGTLNCEDAWHQALPYIYSMYGIDLLVICAASPVRGLFKNSEGTPWNVKLWQKLICSYAHLYGLYIVYVNRAGIEDGIHFSGYSCVVSPLGEIIEMLEPFKYDEKVIEIDIKKARLEKAQNCYLKEDDPFLTMRELQRALEFRRENFK
ncbi:MAG: nitrilase-related carbon-nitrogen hydrolase [Candidatus Wallbacteria bacterium]